MKDYRDDDRHQRWWDERILWRLSRYDISLIVVGMFLAALFIKFPINWDLAFGIR